MKYILFFLIIFSYVSLAGASYIYSDCSVLYEVTSVKNDVSDIQISKKKMDSFFSNRKIDWNSGKLYLFVEKNGALRLFVAEESGRVLLYQYPNVIGHKWLDPFTYMKESQLQVKNVLNEKCVLEYEIQQNFLEELLSMHLDEYPYIRVMGRSRSNGVYKYIPVYDGDEVVYYGYTKDVDEIKYFRFVNLKYDSSERRPPLDKFVELFDKLESFPFSEVVEECK